MRSWRTIAAPVTHEIPKIKRSRFVADVAPVADEDAARAHVAAIRKQHQVRPIADADGLVARLVEASSGRADVTLG